MLVNIIFVVCFVVYGVVGKLFSKGNVNNLELVKFKKYILYICDNYLFIFLIMIIVDVLFKG